MASPKDSTLVVIGSGPGIGAATASFFSTKGFEKVVLISRDAGRLKEDCLAVEHAAQAVQKNVHVASWAADITDTAAFQKVLDKVASFGTVECVLFNAARVQQSDILKEPLEDIEYDFKV